MAKRVAIKQILGHHRITEYMLTTSADSQNRKLALFGKISHANSTIQRCQFWLSITQDDQEHKMSTQQRTDSEAQVHAKVSMSCSYPGAAVSV